MSISRKNAVSCGECGYLPECGGLLETPSVFGCFSECVSNCDPESCDLTCPHNQRLFSARYAEIGGTFRFSSPPLNIPTTQLPGYIPKIDNGTGRSKPLQFPVVAIPARALIRKSGLSISCRFKTPGQVRQHFCLSPRTAYVITCVSVDEEVEMVWHGLRYSRLAEEWSALKPTAVIVPNFSFFVDDVPRTHTLYNRKRICVASSILSTAGCPVVVPLSASTRDDWEYWYKFLRENPEMKYIAKEFQTGLRGIAAGKEAANHLAELQSRLGRSILDCTPEMRQMVKVVYSERETTDYEPQTPHLQQRI